MKVCFVSAYPPNKAYLAEYADYLTNGLKKRNEIKEIIILANKAKKYANLERKGKLKIIRCWKTNSPLILFQLMKSILLVRKKIDVVHFNLNMMNWGTGKMVNFLGYLAPLLTKLFLRKKVVITLHNVVDAINLKKLKFISPSRLTRTGLKLVTKLLLFANKVTVTTSYYKMILEKNYNARNVVHVPHGFLEPIKKPRLTKNVLLAFGFWDPRKKLEVLIKAFKELRKKNPKLKLVVAGTSYPRFPNYLEEVKKKFDIPGIIYTGYVPQHKVKEIFLNSTLVVLPYAVSVGSSGVLHLAASYGKPIIMTKLPDLAEVVKEEGVMVEFTTLKDLKRTIEKLLSNVRLQRKIVKNNLKAARNLSFRVVAKEFVNLYKEVLKG